jgi:hypothetical protein
MIEPGDIILVKPINWVNLAERRRYVGLILEVRDNALWGPGSAAVLCGDDVVRNFGMWEMSPLTGDLNYA